MSAAECKSVRYASAKPCNGPITWQVTYTTTKGVVMDRHPCCFLHGLAEVERHHEAAGIVLCELSALE